MQTHGRGELVIVSPDTKTTEWIKLNEADVVFTLTIINLVYFFLIENKLLFVNLQIIIIFGLTQ